MQDLTLSSTVPFPFLLVIPGVSNLKRACELLNTKQSHHDFSLSGVERVIALSCLPREGISVTSIV